MKTEILSTWANLQRWLGRYKAGQKEFAFRGQAESAWPLRTSLARHFLAHTDIVMANHWRRRELKMYRIFRERLLDACSGMYDAWEPLDILSLMQHHGCPTRMLDFTFSPRVAACFALKDARGKSAVWIVDRTSLDRRRAEMKLPDYCGPEHNPEYHKFQKHEVTDHRLIGSILEPKRLNERLAAQRGCFFVPGAISAKVEDELVHTKVTLSEGLAIESLARLSELGLDEDHLFPNLDKLADEAERLSVAGGPDFPEREKPGSSSGVSG
jgi:hypothetical protein